MIYTLEDRTQAVTGELVFNYYDCKLGVIGDDAGDGWFDLRQEDGSTAMLDGERCCSTTFAIAKGWTTRAEVDAQAPDPEPEPEPTAEVDRADLIYPTCEWFARCDREAFGYVRHPVAHQVLCCTRCARRHDLVFIEVLYPEWVLYRPECGEMLTSSGDPWATAEAAWDAGRTLFGDDLGDGWKAVRTAEVAR